MDINEKLINSIYNEDLEQVKECLAKGANVNYISPLGEIPLREATIKNNLELVKFLVSKGADVNLYDDNDFSSLMIAARYEKSYDIAKYLIDKGADVNAKTTDKRNTALTVAIRNNSNPQKIITTLLEHGADVNAKDKYGNTALMHTILDSFNLSKQNKLNIAKILIDNGANLNIKNNNNDTALTLAQKSDNIDNKEIITLLKGHESLEKAIQQSKHKNKLQPKSKSNDNDLGMGM